MDGYIGNLSQWQTAREPITTEDTELTEYKVADLTTAVKDKMIGVLPATEIAIKVFGKGADNDDLLLTISGWMDPTRPNVGPGTVLFKNTVALGALAPTHVPITGGGWTSGAWREVDTWGTLTAGTSVLHTGLVAGLGTALGKGMLILNTLAFSHLLFEIGDLGALNEATEVGIIWRPTATNTPILQATGAALTS